MVFSNPLAFLTTDAARPAIILQPFEASGIVWEVPLKVSDCVSLHGTYLNSFLPEVKHRNTYSQGIITYYF